MGCLAGQELSEGFICLTGLCFLFSQVAFQPMSETSHYSLILRYLLGLMFIFAWWRLNTCSFSPKSAVLGTLMSLRCFISRQIRDTLPQNKSTAGLQKSSSCLDRASPELPASQRSPAVCIQSNTTGSRSLLNPCRVNARLQNKGGIVSVRFCSHK